MNNLNFTESQEQNTPRTYEDLVQLEMSNNESNSRVGAVKKVELNLFNERISNFEESDLKEDEGGGWLKFEQKIRDAFPEIPEDRFKAFKAAVTMHLCEH